MQWRLPFTPRNIRAFGKWTFINVQNSKPKILLGKKYSFPEKISLSYFGNIYYLKVI